MKNSYDIVGEAVSEFWQKRGIAEPVIAFFYQKYDCAERWDFCKELIDCDCPYPDETAIIFQYDFCEGETCVKDITIVPLQEVTEFYAKHHNLRQEAE